MSDYEFELPFPPSVNGYWRAVVRGKRPAQIISERGRKYRDDVIEKMTAMRLHEEQIKQRLQVIVYLNPPSKREFDLDNYPKSLLDAITKSGFWIDDSQIDVLTIYRGKKTSGGSVLVQVNILDDFVLEAA